MLGLGLALSIAKKTLGDAIDGLLSTLRGRATYYENGSASKSTIKAIDNADVLDKATILLTPTATSDARVHSVKTYTGDELVTNGTFDTDSDWTKGTGWSIANGKASCDGSQTSNSLFYQNIGSQSNKTIKYSFTVSDYVSGTLKTAIFGASGTTVYSITSNGNYTFYIDVASGHNGNTGFEAVVGFEGSIDNVSIVDVSSDFDFDRASSATRINSSGLVQDMQSITDPELVLNGDFEELGDELITNGSLDTNSGWTFVNGPTYNSNGYIDFNLVGGNARTDINVVQDKVYKVVYEIKNYQEGTIKFRLQGGTNTGGQQQSGNGIKTEYVTCNDSSNNNFQFFGSSSFIGSVDNVSVKQVDPNDRWTLGTGWSIEDGKLVAVAPSSSDVASQAFDFEDGGTYKFTFEISDYSSGDVYISKPYDGSADKVGANGTHTFYYVAGSDNAIEFKSDSSFRGSIDNVSIKHVTFEEDNVDLARINYDSNGDNGHILLEPTSTNLLTYSEDFDNSYWNTPNTTVETASITSPDGSNDTYKLFADTGSSSHYFDNINYSGASSGQTYTYSVFVKSAGSDFIQLASSSGFPARYQNFNLSTGAKASGDISNATIEAYPNGWYRISVTETTNSTSRRFLIVPVLTDNSRNPVFVGNAQEDGVYIYGAQLEALPYATSYIPTLTGSTVTRAAETLTGSGNSTLINSTEGVLYAEIAALADDGINKYISINNGNSGLTDYIFFRYRSDDNFQIKLRSGNTDKVNETFTLSNNLDLNKIAFSYKENEFKIFVNGSQVGTTITSGATSVANTLSNIDFKRYDGASPFYGELKSLAVFNEALSDTELTNLTS